MTLTKHLKKFALTGTILTGLLSSAATAQDITPPSVTAEPAMYKIADEDSHARPYSNNGC